MNIQAMYTGVCGAKTYRRRGLAHKFLLRGMRRSAAQTIYVDQWKQREGCVQYINVCIYIHQRPNYCLSARVSAYFMMQEVGRVCLMHIVMHTYVDLPGEMQP